MTTDPTTTDHDNERTAIRQAVADVLTDTAWTCSRDWSAWQHGTMGQDDFAPAWEDDELITSLVEAVAPSQPGGRDHDHARDAVELVADAIRSAFAGESQVKFTTVEDWLPEAAAALAALSGAGLLATERDADHALEAEAGVLPCCRRESIDVGTEDCLRCPGHVREAGAALIAAERRRQVDDEGWTPEHDAEHDDDALTMAAVLYGMPADERRYVGSIDAPVGWPWPSEYWKPSPDDRVRELVKAGALIAAEIDRLLARSAS